MTENLLKISPPTEPTRSGTMVTCFIELESGKAIIGLKNLKSEIKNSAIRALFPSTSPLKPLPK